MRSSTRRKNPQFRRDRIGIRCSRGLSPQQSRVPAPPFPPRGPSGRFPRLPGTIEALRLPAVLPASLRSPSLRGTVVASVYSLSQKAGRLAPVSLDLLFAGGPSGITPQKRRDLPGSWTNPCLRAALYDPGGTSAPGHFQRFGAAAHTETMSAPTNSGLSRLNRVAHMLAVYASPYGLPRPTQDSLAAGGQPLPRRPFTCWVRFGEFP